MSTFVTSVAELESLYDSAVPTSLTKVAHRLTPEYSRWIEASKFCVLSTVGPEGTDGTPRGDDGPVVSIKDPATLLMPDWAGNNRLDSLRNILRDDRLSLMFMVHGNNNVVRVNGTGKITTESALIDRFERNGKRPKTVLIVTIAEVYFQCAKAIIRSKLWQQADTKPDIPSAGDFIKAMTGGKEGGADYDAGYEERAKTKLWAR